MSVVVDKSAVVDPLAKIGENCHIGPYCTIGPNVEIKANTKLISHVIVDGHTHLGADCTIYPFVTIGIQSQDLKYISGTETYCVVGDRNIVREYVCIHSATEEGTSTVVGDDCAFLAHAHVAHNCDVGNHVTFSHAATVGGHVTVGDYANLGGLCAVHQNCQIGRAAMVAGMARVTQDVLPYTIADGFPAHMRVVNRVGMKRAGYTDQEIREVRLAFRTLFIRELRLDEAIEQVQRDLGDRPHIQTMLLAIEISQRGLARPDAGTFEINASDDTL